jgi:membrane-associated phospholipid phosphatase
MLSLFLPAIVDVLTSASDAVFRLANSVAGRSQAVDTLLALPVDNTLIKAGVVAGCLVAAWHTAKEDAALLRGRRMLIIALVATLTAAATTKSLSRTIFLPRPFIQSQKTFHLDGGQLVEGKRLAYRPPLDAESQATYAKLLAGNVLRNDFGSFPSDHAGFYAALAAGIWFASRTLGGIALVWTFGVILGSRVVNGMHSPLDIAAGAGIGIFLLLAFRWVAETFFLPVLDGLARWTIRHPAVSSAAIFMAAYEIANTLQDLRALASTLTDLGRIVMGA